ncbi:MAG: low molecular weight phosphotyrosine protein phosphatase [Proteobacteria bacterium]|nr:low molecular weight phosphotyrosine protein phosphatase [Pseudomonadota bacterium]
MPLRKQENVGVLAAEAGTLGEEAFPLRVLFVCSGNICRSPYAHVVFERLAKKYHREVLVCSAGTLRLVGRPAAPLTIRVAAERGDDLEAHRSTALSKLLVEASDVIFAMSPEHREVMMKLCQDTPGIERRIVMLGSWLSPPEHEIVDPMGKPYEVYQRVAAEIETALERWFEAFEARDARNANTDA